MSHTPGPWALMPNNPLQITDSPDAHDPLYLCEVNGFTHEQALADARLIAAAPDLLEMLFSLAGQAELVAGLPTCGEREVLNGIARQARAAIAKATGADK